MTTIKDVKNGAKLPDPIYATKPYVWFNKDGVILGSAESVDELINGLSTSGTYYDDCRVDIRRHDLYLNDNTLVDSFDNLRKELKLCEECGDLPAIKKGLCGYCQAVNDNN